MNFKLVIFKIYNILKRLSHIPFFALSWFLLSIVILKYLFQLIYQKKKTKISKQTILICSNAYYYLEENSPEIDYIHYWLNKLDFNIHEFYWDKIKNRFSIQYKFLDKVFNTKPDLILLSAYSQHNFNYPSSLLLKLIKKIINSKIAFIWWDTGTNDFLQTINHLIDHKYFDLHIFTDRPAADIDVNNISKLNKETFYFDFNSPERSDRFKLIDKKKYDVVFFGSANSYRSYRFEFIKFLENNLKNYKTFFLATDRKHQVSVKEHDLILSQAKIGLNFSFSVDKHQLKGRAIYTMLSGALLLESKNNQITHCFINGEDFVFFDNKNDLLNKIKYYLNHENERIKIARSGRAKYIAKYSGEAQWGKLLKKLKII